MRTLLFALAATTLIAEPAFAQGVPVSDSQRLTKEVGIANCMQKAASVRQSTLSPSQGTTRSVTTPGTAGQSAQIGTQGVSGSAVDTSGASVSSDSLSIGGLDIGSLMLTANSVNALKTSNFAQVLDAANAVATALSTNTSRFQQVQNTIGSATGEQMAFDQNTGARIAGSQVWNQAVQIGNTMLSLQNMRLMDRISEQAARSRVMAFTPIATSAMASDAPSKPPASPAAGTNDFTPPAGDPTTTNPTDGNQEIEP